VHWKIFGPVCGYKKIRTQTIGMCIFFCLITPTFMHVLPLGAAKNRSVIRFFASVAVLFLTAQFSPYSEKISIQSLISLGEDVVAFVNYTMPIS
jgi:hypothetical protein